MACILLVAVDSKLKTVDRKRPTSAKDLVHSFSCNIESGECMNNSCESFPKYQLMKTTLKRMLNQVQILMNRIHLIEYHPIEYSKWMTINEKVSKSHDVFVF